MVFDPVYLLFGIVFFFLAWIIARQRKEINNLGQNVVDLKVKLEFAKNEIEFSRIKYAEMMDLAEEQIDRADNAERKQAISKRTIHVLRRRKKVKLFNK